MKLEAGMYVRTKYGIEKIKFIDENFSDGDTTFVATDKDEFRGAYNGKFNGFTTRNDVILKASHNIIDLIEKKDLLIDTKNNLYVVDRVDGDYVFTTSKNEYGLIITLVDYQIKSIVTKEQFESMEYKVGDNNE